MRVNTEYKVALIFIILSECSYLKFCLMEGIKPFYAFFWSTEQLYFLKKNSLRSQAFIWVYDLIYQMYMQESTIPFYSFGHSIFLMHHSLDNPMPFMPYIFHFSRINSYIQQLLLLYSILIMVKVTRFVLQHLAQILNPYLANNSPQKIPTLDRHINSYFRQHKSLGPSERKQLYNCTYDLIRYHHYLNHLCKGSRNLQYRLDLLHSSDFYTEMDNKKLAKWIRCSFPKQLYQKIEEAIPTQLEAFDLCKSLNTRAPLTVRVNPEKISRGDFMKKISSYLKMDVEKTQISPYGVKIPASKNINLYETTQFKEGFFEIQDQASQIAALQVKCRPGDLVLDFCSGSGGKSLAISHLLDGKGQLFLHDPREKILENAKKRFQKVGAQNIQFHKDESGLQKILIGKADWIILDVPCSGTGTIRRNPDIKLRFSEQSLKQNIIMQQQIFTKSLKYLKKNGRIVYITCSILQDENEKQIQKFTKNFNMKVVDNEIIRTRTEKGGMDTMFVAVLEEKKKISHQK